MTRKKKASYKQTKKNCKKLRKLNGRIKSSTRETHHADRYAYPFRFKGHIETYLRKTSKSIRSKFSNLNSNAKIYNRCGKFNATFLFTDDNENNTIMNSSYDANLSREYERNSVVEMNDERSKPLQVLI